MAADTNRYQAVRDATDKVFADAAREVLRPEANTKQQEVDREDAQRSIDTDLEASGPHRPLSGPAPEIPMSQNMDVQQDAALRRHAWLNSPERVQPVAPEAPTKSEQEMALKQDKAKAHFYNDLKTEHDQAASLEKSERKLRFFEDIHPSGLEHEHER